MDYEIKENGDGLHIDISAPQREQQRLLEELAKCAAGTCSCPSTQYDKLEKMDVVPGQAGVTVGLKAKAGETIDTADIERCLQHTAKLIRP